MAESHFEKVATEKELPKGPSHIHDDVDFKPGPSMHARDGADGNANLKQLGFPSAEHLLPIDDVSSNSKIPTDASPAKASTLSSTSARGEQETHYLDVGAEIVEGAVRKVVEHPLEVAGTVAAGAVVGLAAAALAPEVAIAGAVAGAGALAYSAFENVGKWWNAGSTVAHSNEHSVDEVAAAKKTLNGIGEVAVDTAAFTAGGAAAPLAKSAGKAVGKYAGKVVDEVIDTVENAGRTVSNFWNSSDEASTLSNKSVAGNTSSSGAESSLQAPAKAAEVVAPERGRLLGSGDEGKVYDAGKFQTADNRSLDSVWKVYDTNGLKNSPESVIQMNRELKSMGIRVPEILETGTTADGHFAIRFEKIGPDGESLKNDLRVGALSLADRKEAQRQYDMVVDKLAANNVYGDITLNNFIWDKAARQLVWVDPGKLQSGNPRELAKAYRDAIAP